MNKFFLIIAVLYFILLFDFTITYNRTGRAGWIVSYNGLVWALLEKSPMISFTKTK